ncbi:MAG: LolA family protein [Thomasclavelia sp.]
MKKIYIGISVVVVAVIATLVFFKFKDTSLDKTIEKVKAYDKYTLTCNMEMVENDELKSYLVNVSYLSNDNNEYYKVELYDKALNQSQIIIKNSDGVFVLTPTLNQIFKFQSEWPNNSPKPYIYQSLIELLEKGEVEKIKDGYQVRSEVTYPNDSRIAMQEMVFDKSLAPKQVTVLDKEDAEIITAEFTEFKTDIDLNSDAFNEKEVLESAKTEYSSASSDLPLYPIALMGSTLDSEEVSTIDGTTNHILKFTGDKSFTVIETPVEASDSIVVENVSGEAIDLVDGVAFYNDGELMMMKSGVLCKVYSQDLDKDEMVSVISSMQSSNLK